MIKLKEAKKIVDDLIDNNDIKLPSNSTLRRWAMNGLITKVEEFEKLGRTGGRIGLYDDTLPLQIYTVLKLKNDLELKKVSERNKEILTIIKENNDIELIINKFEEKIDEDWVIGGENEEEMLERIVEKHEKKSLLKKYAKYFKEAALKLKKVV